MAAVDAKLHQLQKREKKRQAKADAKAKARAIAKALPTLQSPMILNSSASYPTNVAGPSSGVPASIRPAQQDSGQRPSSSTSNHFKRRDESPDPLSGRKKAKVDRGRCPVCTFVHPIEGCPRLQTTVGIRAALTEKNWEGDNETKRTLEGMLERMRSKKSSAVRPAPVTNSNAGLSQIGKMP